MLKRLLHISPGFWVALIFLGILLAKVSPLIMSVAMGGLFVTAFLSPGAFRKIPHLFIEASAGIFVLFFLLVLVSGTYSQDTAQWLERLRIKVPFLMLPLAFFVIPKPNEEQLHRTLYFIWALMIGAALLSIGWYLADREAITDAITRGKSMPTPINHIRFSLMAVFAAVSGYYLLRQRFVLKFKWEKWLQILGTVFLMVFIHIWAIRSGMLALYLCLGAVLLYEIWRTRKWIFLGSLLVALPLIPIIAYKTVPTFRNKVDYMSYDLIRFKAGDTGAYSDGRRLRSMEASWQVGMQHKWFGVGYGDIKHHMRQYYETHHPDLPAENSLDPHNQFLYVFVGLGFFGLGIFMWAMLYPLWLAWRWRNILFMCFNLIAITSLIPEYPLENQVGTAFYLTTLFFLYFTFKPHEDRGKMAERPLE
jgi:O-antigen ligase